MKSKFHGWSAAALVTCAVATFVLLAATTRDAGAVPAEGGKVTICHMPGHEGDFRIGSPEPDAAYHCEVKLGGNAITIAIPACENGHDLKATKKGDECAPDGTKGSGKNPAEPADPAEAPPQ